MRRQRAPLADIRLLVLDVNGVMTYGRLYYGPKGETLKVFHVRDGLGIRAVMAAGIEVSVISGRRSAMDAALPRTWHSPRISGKGQEAARA